MQQLLLAACALAASTLSSPVAAEEEFVFESPQTTISGLLLVNFVMLGSGEMIKGYTLHLSDPITVTGNPESQNRKNRKTVKDVNVILLDFAQDAPSDEIMGSDVEILGQLLNEPSDPHHTKVMMVVKSLTVTSAPEPGKPIGSAKTH